MLINDRLLNVETYGPENGHQVVLLHHGLGSISAWRKQISNLADAGFHILVYDRWGYGKSESRPYLSVPDFVDDLDDLDKILSNSNFLSPSLIGHSDGGTIALYYAARNPNRVSALVTVAAHIYLEPKMEPGIQKIRQAFELDSRFREGLRRVHGRKFESVFNNWFYGWQTPKTRDWDMRPLLSQITCPTLVIQGKEDQHATNQHARDIADSISNSNLWLVPEAQHMLPQDKSDIFNPKLLDFLIFTNS